MIETTGLFPVPVRTPLSEARDVGPEEYVAQDAPDWCAACGHAGVLESLRQACASLGLASKDLLLVAGAGCAGRVPRFFYSYGLSGPAGRALPLAAGARLANPDLCVVALGGDAETLGPGAGHLLHAARSNVDITFILLDNMVQGLAGGLAGPTTMLGHATPSTPDGCVERPLDPASLALVAGATFVARVYAGDGDLAGALIARAIQHRGFSFVHALSPCPAFNAVNTHAWMKERAGVLEDAGQQPSLAAALALALDTEKLWQGVLYETLDVPTCEDADPTICRSGAAVRESLGLSPKEIEELKEELR
ncbi:MAG: 2-oxoacid ferredoxin oxidoreductase [Elusimicrobia bacterium]|nr:2-oxoacid ferredoxin oxidoreductase [Elusimicrobiota bacterium]